MSVFGVDFGTLNSTVAVTRQGGVDIVCNEVSKRDTASFVSYLGEERLIGEAGLDRAVRNYQNTASCLKRLIGLKRSDPRCAEELRFMNCNTTEDEEGRLMLEVDYCETETKLYPEQALAALMGKLRKYVAVTTGSDAKDCVVTVPAWYTAEQRKLVIQSCEMAKLNCMSLVNETTAACVDYGIFRQASLPEKEEEAQLNAVIDIGNAGTTITIANFWKGNCKVLAHHWDNSLGTRNIDDALFAKAAADVQKKYGVDPTTNRKARLRLLAGCDKCKCMLSAGPVAPLNVENLMDVDVNMQIKREDIDELIAPLAARLKEACQMAVSKAGLDGKVPASVECIGGGIRVPAFKAAVGEAFGVAPSFTLNANESIARGCAITAAAFSPLFQVRPFVIHEVPRCPVKLAYAVENPQSPSALDWLPQINKVITVLGAKDHFPKTLELTFNKDDMEIFAFCDEDVAAATGVGAGRDLLVGHWKVGTTDKPTKGGVKIHLRFEASGLVSLIKAVATEVYEVEVEETVIKKDGAASPAAASTSTEATPQPEGAEKSSEKRDEDAPKKEGGEKPGSPKVEVERVKVKKQRSRHLHLSVTPNVVLGHKAEVFSAAAKAESDHDTRDLKLQRTKEVRNELESYIYDNRGSMQDGALKAFAAPADAESFIKLCNEFEEWLYGDGECAEFDAISERLSKLKVVGDAAKRRLRFCEDIDFAQKSIIQKLKDQKQIALEQIGKAEHITAEELNGAASKADEAIAWVNGEVKAFEAQPKHEDAKITTTALQVKLTEVTAAVKVVVNKPKPAPSKEAKPEAKKDEDSPTVEKAADEDAATAEKKE